MKVPAGRPRFSARSATVRLGKLPLHDQSARTVFYNAREGRLDFVGTADRRLYDFDPRRLGGQVNFFEKQRREGVTGVAKRGDFSH